MPELLMRRKMPSNFVITIQDMESKQNVVGK